MRIQVKNKLHPSQAVIEYGGHFFKHLVIKLRAEQTIAAVRETPDTWSAIQSNRTYALNRGDRVSLISADGDTICDQCVVVRAEGGQVQLSKPLRLIQLDPVALFSTGLYEVVPAGTGYSLKGGRSGHVEDKIFATVEAAKTEIFRRQPSKAA